MTVHSNLSAGSEPLTDTDDRDLFTVIWIPPACSNCCCARDTWRLARYTENGAPIAAMPAKTAPATVTVTVTGSATNPPTHLCECPPRVTAGAGVFSPYQRKPP